MVRVTSISPASASLPPSGGGAPVLLLLPPPPPSPPSDIIRSTPPLHATNGRAKAESTPSAKPKARDTLLRRVSIRTSEIRCSVAGGADHGGVRAMGGSRFVDVRVVGRLEVIEPAIERVPGQEEDVAHRP